MSGPSEEAFAVKFRNNPQGIRVLVNDHVSAKFGRVLDAPIPEAVVVDVDPEVASTIPFSNGAIADGGSAHGSRWLVPDVRQVVDQSRVLRTRGNPARYVFLDVLFDVLASADQQWVVAWKPPFQVSCVDFGWSLTGQPNWDQAGLAAAPWPVALSRKSRVAPEAATLVAIGQKLNAISDDGIAGCVAGLPDTWNVSAEEKAAICDFLRVRLTSVMGLLPAPSTSSP